ATNSQRLFGTPNEGPYVKDGINERVVRGCADTINPAQEGTKAAAHYRLEVASGETAVLRLRLADTDPRAATPFAGFDETVATRLREADACYDAITPPALSADERLVMRQALAGMLWSKQHYFFDLDAWLEAHGAHPLSDMRWPDCRNINWFHMVTDDVISMPDKWEYPWFAAWDLAFHTVALSVVDLDFAKQQVELRLRDVYQHPSGQVPAYEWSFGDVNPPVHAWATLYIYHEEKFRRGAGDVAFLRRAFHGLVRNFTWWLNRKDPGGRNVFEGGFLGLDNIGVFDRSRPLPTGGHLEQADGTAWMAFYCGTMLSMALELASEDPAYEDVASKFFEHFVAIVDAMNTLGGTGVWDDDDGFYYDQLLAHGHATKLKIRSMVGIIPLFAVEVLETGLLKKLPGFTKRLNWFLENRRDLARHISYMTEDGESDHNHRLLAIPTR